VELAVSNDGVAIDASLDLERTGTLGLQLVQLLARQLDGTLEVERAGPVRFGLRFQVKEPTA
jgi:two-component sensor histidine kinase